MFGGDFLNDVLSKTKDAISIFDENLLIGNHDTITLLGAQSQVKLKDYTKAVSKLFLSDKDDLESAILDVVNEMDRLEKSAFKKQRWFHGRSSRYQKITKEYEKSVLYIERVSTFFQLQKAQLLKEIKYLEKLSITIGESISSLEKCIELGNRVIQERSSHIISSDNQCMAINTDGEDIWYSRLQRRLNDLSISQTVAKQSQAQISMLYNNNLLLLDRLSSAISNTFPIWQNQMTILLGITELEHRLNEQDKVYQCSKKQSATSLNVDTIIATNEKLRTTLKEAISLEKQDTEVRKHIQETMLNMERG